MDRLNVTSIILTVADKAKPLLIKLIPIGFLRRVKKGMIDSAMIKLEREKVKPFARAANPDGVNLIGFIRGEIGLGESCRLVAGGLRESGLDFTVYNYEQISAMQCNDFSWDDKITNTAPYNINLIHIQPYELPLAFVRISRDIWDGRYNIAFWLWELEDFPQEWENALALVDEIWTPSEFSSESIRKATGKPVYTIPYAMAVPDCGFYNRESFHFPEDMFLFLCMYDCNSTMERKNPMAAINAYKQAFSSAERRAGLVLKMNNPQQKDIDVIHEALSGYPNIYIVADVLEKIKVNALIAITDVYVSLHRSEGFGLVPAEAMLLGTPVIATNWSSNTEFMNADTACLVDFNLIDIDGDYGPYRKGNRWADPDIAQAAGFMRKLYEDKGYHQQIAKNAKACIEEKLAPIHAAGLIRARIMVLYEKEGLTT